MGEFQQCGDPKCEITYEMAGENTAVFIFEHTPQYNYVLTECPKCGYQYLVFIDDIQLMSVEEYDWPEKKAPNAPTSIRELFDLCDPEEPIKFYDLSPRHERYIEVLKWELEDATVADILAVDVEKRLPKRWV